MSPRPGARHPPRTARDPHTQTDRSAPPNPPQAGALGPQYGPHTAPAANERLDAALSSDPASRRGGLEVHVGRASHARRDAYSDAPGPADPSYCPPCEAPHPNRQPLGRRRAFGRCWGACAWALLVERSERRPQSNWIEEAPPGPLDRDGGAALDMPASTARDPFSAAEAPFRHRRTRHPLTRPFSSHDRTFSRRARGNSARTHDSSTHASKRASKRGTDAREPLFCSRVSRPIDPWWR